MNPSEFAGAYRLGVASQGVPRASNPYMPAEPGTRQARLAQTWLRGRLAAMPPP